MSPWAVQNIQAGWFGTEARQKYSDCTTTLQCQKYPSKVIICLTCLSGFTE